MSRTDSIIAAIAGESPSEAENDAAAVLKGGVIGAIAGGVGLLAMAPILFSGVALGVIDSTAFAELAYLGLGRPENPLLGYVIFAGGGMTTWPLLFAVLNDYLPGRTMVQSGFGFATIMWTGFLVAFYTSQTGLALVLYLLLTLLAHWAYGVLLGLTFAVIVRRTDVLFVSTDTMSVSEET
jgi:MFS family permease